MPKNFKRKRRFRRRKAKVPKRIRNYVAKAINSNIEDKHHFSTNAGGVLNNVNPVSIGGFASFIVPGTGSGTRIGEVIHLTKWRMSLEFTILQSVPTDVYQDTQVRAILFRLKSKQSTAPIVPSGSGAPTGLLYDNGVGKAILSPWNPDTVPSIYEILSDRTYRLDVNATSTADKTLRTFTVNKRFGKRGKIVQYEHNSNNVNKGDIFCYLYSNVLNPLTISYVYSSMLFYQDA